MTLPPPRPERLSDLNVLPGDMVVWANPAYPDELLFGVNVLTADGVERYTVRMGAGRVAILVQSLTAWLEQAIP